MVRFIAWILFMAAIGFSVHCLLEFVRRRAKKSKLGIVRQNTGFLLLGIVCVVFFGGFIYIMMKTHRDRLNFGLIPVLALFAVVGAVFVINWFTSRIWYDESHFTVRNFWGIRKEYSYSDITGVFQRESVYFLMGKRKIEVPMFAEGSDRFIRIVFEKYAQIHGGEEIPFAEKLPGDIFYGRFKQGEDFIVIAAMLTAFFGGLIISSFIPPSDMFSEYFEMKLYVPPLEQDDDLAIYFAEQEEPFIIRDYEQYSQNTELLREEIDGQAEFYVNAEYHASSRTSEAYYHINNMKDNRGYVYVTYDMVWEQEAGKRMTLSIVGGLFLTVIAGYGVLCVIVCRNPEKHKRLAKICFSKWLWK